MENFLLHLLKVILALLVIFVVIVTFIIRRGQYRALLKVAARFSNAKPWLFNSVKGKFLGFEFQVTLMAAGKHSPPRMILSIFKHSPFTLRIERENSLARLGKRLGLVREVQINDPSFDSQFLIFSNRPVQAVNFLTANTKNILKEFFAEGFESFQIDSRFISIRKSNYSVEKDLEPGKVELMLRKLISVYGSTA